MCRAEYGPALELAEDALAAARSLVDASLMVVGEGLLVAVLAQGGRLVDARSRIEDALAAHARSGAPVAILPTLNHEPGQLFHSLLARWLWILGYPDQALRCAAEGEEAARRLAHPHSLAHAGFFAGIVHVYRRDPPAVRSRVRLVDRICAKWGFPLWLAGARFMSGWCRAQERPDEEAIGEMREGLEGWLRTGCLLETTHYAGLLAGACASAGRVNEALSLVRETLASIADAKNGERFQEAELHRLEGELVLRTTAPDRCAEAESCFRRAIDVATLQRAKSWQLRAATSLARLLAQEGRREEARAGLAAAYGWFTEGFETPDLRDARALLDQL
jgi:adenylate cyclase